jgi:hypothetical protein
LHNIFCCLKGLLNQLFWVVPQYLCGNINYGVFCGDVETQFAVMVGLTVQRWLERREFTEVDVGFVTVGGEEYEEELEHVTVLWEVRLEGMLVRGSDEEY